MLQFCGIGHLHCAAAFEEAKPSLSINFLGDVSAVISIDASTETTVARKTATSTALNFMVTSDSSLQIVDIDSEKSHTSGSRRHSVPRDTIQQTNIGFVSVDGFSEIYKYVLVSTNLVNTNEDKPRQNLSKTHFIRRTIYGGDPFRCHGA